MYHISSQGKSCCILKAWTSPSSKESGITSLPAINLWPDILTMMAVKCRYPRVPLLALTATATPRVQADVVQQLCLQHCAVFRASFNRPNLRCVLASLPAKISTRLASTPMLSSCRYEVSKKRAKFDDAIVDMKERIMRDFVIGRRLQCGIVYCLSRNDCERVAASLQVALHFICCISLTENNNVCWQQIPGWACSPPNTWHAYNQSHPAFWLFGYCLTWQGLRVHDLTYVHDLYSITLNDFICFTFRSTCLLHHAQGVQISAVVRVCGILYVT